MDEKEIRRIVRDEVSKASMANFSSGAPMVPPHKHNAVDNIRISENDLILYTAYSGSVSFARNAVYQFDIAYANIKSVHFNGIALTSSSITTIIFRQGFSSGDSNGILVSVWSGSTGYRLLTFSSGEQVSALFTNNSLTVSWPQPLTFSASSTAQIIVGGKKAFVVGNAQIRPGFYLQPVSNSEVTPGGPKQGIMQSSTNLYIDSGNIANLRSNISQFRLVQVVDETGVVVAQLTIASPFSSDSKKTTVVSGKQPLQLTCVVATGWSIIGNFNIN